MLGSVPLSVKALGDDTILLAGVAEMDGLGVQTSVGVGTLVGEASLSANLTQTTAGIYISGSAAAEMSANFTETSVATRVKGTTQELDFSTNLTQTTAGVGTFVGASSQNINFTQTSVGDLLFTDISPSVTVTWSNITHTGDSWTDVTHTGDSWTDVTHTGDSWTDVTHTGDTWTDITP